MSTRSNIAIELREEDRNKVFTTPWGSTISPKGAKYLVIYCHNDGYPSGVGYGLLDKNFTYDSALKYILQGDRSAVDLTYWDWREEMSGPCIIDTLEVNEDYLYIIKEENSSIAIYVKDDFKYVEETLLTKILD